MRSVHRPALAAAALAALAPLQERSGPAPGVPAPELAVREWLDGAPPFQVGQGRAAVLVFWATWCGSCIAEFPRLNALVDELAGEPLAFVSLSDEPRAKVEEMLALRPLRARVALDDERKTFDAYGVRVLPRIALVDARGRLVALPRLEDVDAGVLRALAAGETVELAEARNAPADEEWDEGKAALDAAQSLAHAWIERSSSASCAMRFPPDKGRISGDGVGFANLAQIAYGAEPHQVRSTHPLYDDFETVYRVSIKAPDNRPETAREMLREQIARLWPHRAEWVEVEEPTPVLRRIPGKELTGLRPTTAAASSGWARHGAIHFVKLPIERIAAMLGTFGFGGEMIDETGVTGEYDIDLEWTPGSASKFAEALAACGLESVNEPRRVRRLHLAPAD